MDPSERARVGGEKTQHAYSQQPKKQFMNGHSEAAMHGASRKADKAHVLMAAACC